MSLFLTRRPFCRAFWAAVLGCCSRERRRVQEQRSIELRKAELAEARLQRQRNEEYEVRL